MSLSWVERGSAYRMLCRMRQARYGSCRSEWLGSANSSFSLRVGRLVSRLRHHRLVHVRDQNSEWRPTIAEAVGSVVNSSGSPDRPAAFFTDSSELRLK